MTDTAAPPTTTADDRSRWIALYVLCASVLMIVIDATIVNVALPSICLLYTSPSPRDRS